jgi:hypothetical protein
VTLKLGIALILASALPWLALPLAAWWAPSIVAKVAWSTGLLVASEALFWAGVLLAGRDVWAAAKQAGWPRLRVFSQGVARMAVSLPVLTKLRQGLPRALVKCRFLN